MVFSMVFMCFHGFRMLCRTKRPHGCCDGRRDGCLDGRRDGRCDGRPDGRPDGRRDGRCDGRPNGRRVPTAVATVVLTVQTKCRRPNAASRHATARRLPSSRADLLLTERMLQVKHPKTIPGEIVTGRPPFPQVQC